MSLMPSKTDCPTADDFRRLLHGEVNAAERAGREEHLRDCEGCRRLLQLLQMEAGGQHTPVGLQPAGDTRRVEMVSVQSEEPSPAVVPSMLWSSACSAGDVDSLSEAASPPRPVEAPEAPCYPFLEPPREPGEIGWLGSYRVRGVLGEGGMGVVFDAEDTQLRRRVALKVMKPELAANLSFRQRFLQEARAAAGVASDHVVTIYQVGLEKDVPFLAMQYLHGESVEQRLQRMGRLSILEVVRIGRGVAEGLVAAHDRGLIHRDIKPANIWLETKEEGGRMKDEQKTQSPSDSSFILPPSSFRVKILDFGLARMADASQRLTATGLIVGTPHYLAPEQARGLSLDARADLFSLGCVLYRLLTDRLPFDGPDALAVLAALAGDEPPLIEQLRPDAPAPLCRLVSALLARERDRRPPDARTVAAQLAALEHGRADTELFAAPAARQGQRGPRPLSRRLLVLAGAVATLFLLVALAWHFWPRSSAVNPGVDRPAELPAAGRAPSSKVLGEPIKVGVMFSLRGPLGSSGSAVSDATRLAIDEINSQGGVLGRPIEPVMVDGQSRSQEFARLADKLLNEERVCAVFGCWTSSSRKTVRPIFEEHDHLLFYPVQYEGLEQSPNIVYLGAAPNQQILPAIRYAVGFLRKRRLFLVGSDYVFPRTAGALIRDSLREDTDVQIVGETYLPLGSGDVQEVVHQIQESKADLIVNTINGDTNAVFFRALCNAGVVPARVPVLSFSVGENELRAVEADDVIGDYAAWNYFQSVDRPENTEFVRKFQARYGPRVISDPMEAAYVAVYLWARGVEKAGSTEPAAVRRAVKGQWFAAPEGPVQIDPENNHAWRVVRVGRVVAGGQFEIVWSSERPIRPEPFPATHPRNYWDRFLTDLYEKWGGHWEAPLR
jgi:urea transport system substrate-binding protein